VVLDDLFDQEQTPDPSMAEGLTRRYGVDVELGPPFICSVA
jgi:hypothetical protein